MKLDKKKIYKGFNRLIWHKNETKKLKTKCRIKAILEKYGPNIKSISGFCGKSGKMVVATDNGFL